MWLPVCRTGEGLVWRNDVSVEAFPEICSFSTLGFRVLLFFRAKYRRYLFWGRPRSQLPFILGGSDARDVGCGMWAGWLAASTEIRFPPARKSKHSQSAVCAAHPRSPTAALKPIWDAGWSKPLLPPHPQHLPFCPPPSASSQSSSPALEPGSGGGVQGKMLLSFLKSGSGSVWRGPACLNWHGGWRTTGGGGAGGEL